jgi:hypothetical protein
MSILRKRCALALRIRTYLAGLSRIQPLHGSRLSAAGASSCRKPDRALYAFRQNARVSDLEGEGPLVTGSAEIRAGCVLRRGGWTPGA